MYIAILLLKMLPADEDVSYTRLRIGNRWLQVEKPAVVEHILWASGIPRESTIQ